MNVSAENATRELTELSTDDVLNAYVPAVFILGRYVHVLWYVIGFFGNIISAVIWNTNHMYNVCSVAHYLVTISCCDVICQFLDIFYYMKVYWRVTGFNKTVQCEVWSILYMIPLYISELLVLGFTIEKLISIRNPFRSGWFSRHQRAPKEIVWIVVSVTALSLPQAYIWKVDNKGFCDDDRHSDVMEFAIWNWLTDVFMYVVIPCSVVILNFIIIDEAKHSIIGHVPKTSDAGTNQSTWRIFQTLRHSTKVLLRLSFFRVITLLPYTIVYFMRFHDLFKPSLLPRVYSFEDVDKSAIWQRYIVLHAVRYVAYMIAGMRNAFSVIIFTVSSNHFKRELIKRSRNRIRTCLPCVRTEEQPRQTTASLRVFQDD